MTFVWKIFRVHPYLGELLIIDRSLMDLDSKFWIIHSMDFSSYEKL